MDMSPTACPSAIMHPMSANSHRTMPRDCVARYTHGTHSTTYVI